MKTTTLPKFLKFIAGIILLLGSISLILMIGFMLLAGFGAFANYPIGYSFGLNLSWPAYFEINPELYSLQSDTLGTGEIIGAQGSFRFESPHLNSIGAGIEIAIWGLLIGIPILFIVFMLYRIFDSMEDETPFVIENVRRIRWIAGLLIFSTVSSEIAQARIMERLFRSVITEGLEIIYRVNLNTQVILIGLIIFAIAEVFRYGLELQTEADLTV